MWGVIETTQDTKKSACLRFFAFNSFFGASEGPGDGGTLEEGVGNRTEEETETESIKFILQN